MDTAFYNRTGFTAGWMFADYSFYPKPGTDFWLQRWHPFIYTKVGHDDIQGGKEAMINAGVRFNLTRQGYINISHIRGHEPWQGTDYDFSNNVNFFGAMQVTRWLNVFGGGGSGLSIYYDPVDHFQGRSWFAHSGFDFQPNQHLTISLNGNSISFDRADTGEPVYAVTIVNTRTTYQFNKHFLARFLAQYDSSEKRVLTDLLASYELVAGTVFHVGYGSLYEKDREFPGAPPQPPNSHYLMVNRGLFLKASYVHRF